MWDFIMNHYYEIAAVILFGIGFMNLLVQRNLIKKLIGLNIMDTAIYLFLAARGFVFGRIAPVPQDLTNLSAETFINPIPSGLVLTGIVVSVSTTAFGLALALKLYRRYRTLNLDEILVLSKKEREDKKQ
ncbi:MAG: cation:proton antiporter subunit C [Solobacterium sp.]|nr:cation:proton antiporter subunit C [Solobacterium sp.]